ncbi:conserved hypothetical protein [Theileria orientalis strain Shintoku]|uniref:Uncharacterized protein n=1 Tax=Theileria orientalis strain Shintoku TaxID=869250 RepID=J4D6C4_THEOR|nr:conserved hypothetical protein [Theileria orientalis strain Shintoku]PVC53971.1 hypothetical protein MACL_00003381 [Theileria orientalis]BAM39490.1 conserved hypothetical protein [Theileria orientalis strain Shintoku]|eukprot:XP_009689791.1 conserved hypothetical protein [Theileria orientalis strain Shintoku]
MDNDLKNKATLIFNGLNRYLNLLNYKPSDYLKYNFFGSSNFLEKGSSRPDSKHTRYYDRLCGSIAHDLDFDVNPNTILSDILYEADSIGLDSRTSLSYINKVDPADSVIMSQESEALEEIGSSESEEKADSNEKYELISNLSSDRSSVKGNESDDRVFVGTADSNFVNYTYWSVETGDNVSTTSKPLYFSDKKCTISLLQEAEAFVASVLWHSQNSFKHTPRHLLFHVTQIANRAFFDPDYRKYLQLNYV